MHYIPKPFCLSGKVRVDSRYLPGYFLSRNGSFQICFFFNDIEVLLLNFDRGLQSCRRFQGYRSLALVLSSSTVELKIKHAYKLYFVRQLI